MLPVAAPCTALLVILHTSFGSNDHRTTLPNVDDVNATETATSVLPYNISDKGRASVCDSPGTRIIGGSTASQGDFPYQVSVRESGWNLRHFCGGSVIDENHVLTAAHCVLGRSPGDINIIAGDVMLDRSSCTSVRRSVSAIFVHENYNRTTFENDIALLRVEKPFPKDSEFIMSIRLADTTVEQGTPCNVTGWGLTNTSASELPNNLQFVEVPIISVENCSVYNSSNPIREGMICAGCQQGGKDSCQGDSGGPLQCGGSLIGIVSWGRGCAEPRYPGVYTEVAYYVNWIDETKHKTSSATTLHGYFLNVTILLPFMITIIRTLNCVII